MSRFIPHTDMSADELIQCSYQALAVLSLCESAAWAIEGGSSAQSRAEIDQIADSIGSGLRLAIELLGPVHDALECHEGLKGGAK